MVAFQIANVDLSYDFVSLYFSRKYSDQEGVPVTEYGKVDKTYKVID
jgi:hypothetical protein